MPPNYLEYLLIIVIVVIAVALYALTRISSVFDSFISKEIANNKTPEASPGELYDLEQRQILIKQITRVTIIASSIIAIGFLVYYLISGTRMQGFVMEWLNLLIRWTHVVAGIMWIGASFYFIFLENNLNRTDGVRDELAGNLWAIHGGGFYFLEKYKLAPKELPKKLHWFKYEAYFTWMSGMALLWVVYYMDAKAFLINPENSILPLTAILVGTGSLAIGWVIYDRMCKSPLIRNYTLFTIVGILVLGVFSWFFAQIFSARAAYIHVGALIGTLMAWNVYFIIIPAQKALVRAAITGQPLDPTLGKKAGERSLHNNYFTLPVIFIMISNHFPTTFGNKYNWILLMVIMLASAGIKHFWNLHERGEKSGLVLPVSIVVLISLALITSPAFEKKEVSGRKIEYSEISQIMTLRCIQCHSSLPTDDLWTAAPNGIMFDTPDQVKQMAERIMIRVTTNTMPQGNKTNMTDEEREAIRSWVLQGANLD